MPPTNEPTSTATRVALRQPSTSQRVRSFRYGPSRPATPQPFIVQATTNTRASLAAAGAKHPPSGGSGPSPAGAILEMEPEPPQVWGVDGRALKNPRQHDRGDSSNGATQPGVTSTRMDVLPLGSHPRGTNSSRRPPSSSEACGPASSSASPSEPKRRSARARGWRAGLDYFPSETSARAPSWCPRRRAPGSPWRSRYFEHQ